MNYKSPFIVKENFLSPSLCEKIVNDVGFIPYTNGDEKCFDERYEKIIFERFKPYLNDLNLHYNTTIKGLNKIQFEWIQTGNHIPIHCENSIYQENHWVVNKPYDFTCIIFLTDYCDESSLDVDYECYGGCLEFINHKFHFKPQRGNLIVFPSDARFCNASSLVNIGNMYQMRFHITTTTPYVYQPKNFPGDYTKWFR